MKEFVLDCSVTMSWFLEDEQSDLGDSILESLTSNQAVVPPIWPYEIANVLAVCKHSVSAYGAAYIELAQRLSLPMATLDQTLAKHARDLGITVLS